MKVWQLLIIRVVVILVAVAVLGTIEGLIGGGPR